MATVLPAELIVTIADYLVDQQQQISLLDVDVRRRHDCLWFTSLPWLYTDPHKTWLRQARQSALALALFNPVLLDEYVKVLHKKAVFVFYGSGDLYRYISRQDLSESTLAMRRGIRYVRLVRWRGSVREERDHCCSKCTPWDPCGSRCYASIECLDYCMVLMPNIKKIHINMWGDHPWDNRPPRRNGPESTKQDFRRLLRDVWLLMEKLIPPVEGTVSDVHQGLVFGYREFGRWIDMDGRPFATREAQVEEHLEILSRFHEAIGRVKGEELHLVRRNANEEPSPEQESAI